MLQVCYQIVAHSYHNVTAEAEGEVAKSPTGFGFPQSTWLLKAIALHRHQLL
jgi:hypothetical protein